MAGPFCIEKHYPSDIFVLGANVSKSSMFWKTSALIVLSVAAVSCYRIVVHKKWCPLGALCVAVISKFTLQMTRTGRILLTEYVVQLTHTLFIELS